MTCFFFLRSCRSAYHVVTDVAILRFMVEVCWGPMLAAFSVTLDQSDDRLAAVECLRGFRYVVHVTAVMGMHTQRDAFVNSMAKFTNLHCAGDMKQKNVDAVKVSFFLWKSLFIIKTVVLLCLKFLTSCFQRRHTKIKRILRHTHLNTSYVLVSCFHELILSVSLVKIFSFP